VAEVKPGLTPASFSLPESNLTKPEVLVIGSASFEVAAQEGRTFKMVVPAMDLAKSIVDDFNLSLPQVAPEAYPALFWISGEFNYEDVYNEKTKKVSEYFQYLAQPYLDKQDRWFQRLVQSANSDWTRFNKNPQTISDLHRKAARALGLTSNEIEWIEIRAINAGDRCPACRMPKIPGAIICAHCKAIFDKKAYEAIEFAKG
jgi:hypothetical protein